MTHEFDSAMLYIHPPAAIIGYVLVILSFIFIINELRVLPKIVLKKYTRWILYSSWFLNLFGITTGMLWAQVVWGSYWSWDPKETVTLIIFIFACLATLSYEIKQKKIAFLMLIFAIIAIIFNLLITLGNFGLHSYGIYFIF